jgi:hypothetical protein
MFDFDHPDLKETKLLGLFAILDAHSFRMEGGEKPNERPKSFGSQALVLKAEHQ